MKNKVNILEEINKMKSLIRAKAGMVISEQETDLDKDVTELRTQLNNNFTDEQKVVDILKKYVTDRNTFKRFEDKFVEKYAVKPSEIMSKSLEYGNDQEEINDLNSALLKIGLRYQNSGGIAKFEELSVVRQRNINANYCRVKDGKIVFPNTAYSGSLWSSYVSTNKVTPEEIAAAKATCPQVVVPDVAAPAADTPKPAGPTSSQRFVVSSQSLGIQNPKMDVTTLQTILNKLNQGGQGITESKNSVDDELNMMKYLSGYQRGKVISEQTSPAASPTSAESPLPAPTPKDLIVQIQTVLNDKFKQSLGPTGADGKWGKFSQDALENALKNVGDVSQRRASETQQTTAQDDTIQKAVEKGRMEIPKTNNQPTLPGIQVPVKDIYTTLVNNKTLVTRDENTYVYKGADLTSPQKQELESKLLGMGFRLSTVRNDFRAGDKLVFKRN